MRTLRLTPELECALNEALQIAGLNNHVAKTVGRRWLALRSIEAVCQAVVRSGSLPIPFGVNIRREPKEETAARLLLARLDRKATAAKKGATP